MRGGNCERIRPDMVTVDLVADDVTAEEWADIQEAAFEVDTAVIDTVMKGKDIKMKTYRPWRFGHETAEQAAEAEPDRVLLLRGEDPTDRVSGGTSIYVLFVRWRVGTFLSVSSATGASTSSRFGPRRSRRGGRRRPENRPCLPPPVLPSAHAWSASSLRVARWSSVIQPKVDSLSRVAARRGSSAKAR